MLVAGDTFHVRGTVSPTVLNYVSDAYEWIVKDLGLSVAMLAGNHDLETNDSVYSANAAAAQSRLAYRSSAVVSHTASNWVTSQSIW